MKYRIGLDIGIGSVGWAVVSSEEKGHPARIEDFGTRIFNSGEEPKTSESLCKQRRGFRSVRRLERRRSNRKKMLLNHLKNIGLTNDLFNDDLAELRDCDVYNLKVNGLDKKLSPAELYKCLAHTCNHRGYHDFYEPEEDDEEAGKNESAANEFEKEYNKSGARTVSEYLILAYKCDGFVKFRNREGTKSYILIRRKLFEDEVDQILNKQTEFYPCLTEINKQRIHKIIFDQRDFEDGPGNANDPDRRYRGFIETLGACPFYQGFDRGFRGTVISDVFSVTNTLSQYRYICEETGEYSLDPCVAKELVERLLFDGKLTVTTVKSIAKKHGYKMLKSDNTDDNTVGKSIKFLGIAKKAVEAAGLSWITLISEEQFDPDRPSLLHKIGELISTYQTPSRRIKEMKNAGIDEKLIRVFSDKKTGGTASASYKYMCDAINAFLCGDIYGNFQANRNKELIEKNSVERTLKISPAQINDPDLKNNRVVFKAINETRKIINAIIDVYGSPEEVVIEIASELGKSLGMRKDILTEQKKNENENKKVKEEIAKLLPLEDENKISGAMIERYKLFIEQEGKSAYSCKPLGELRDVVENKDKVYEVDHIVPYSLILDNTLENKALVFSKENQMKRQRTPLMYLSDVQEKEAFIAFVNYMYSRDKKQRKPISKKKLAYYKLETIYGEDAEEILNAWKSRNINDTRYITKYIAGLIDKYLIFTGDKKQHVFTVKGSVTQKFRREWFKDSPWGLNEKDRSTYLNHALDALIAANLTKAYIEIGSDALRLGSIYRYHKNQISSEYNEYLEKCIDKMKKYYGFSEEYTRSLLRKPNKVPSYVPRLTQEVNARFNDSDENSFYKEVMQLYNSESPFLVPPHMPITSQKQVKKFKGCIADSKPIKVIEIDGVPHKIRRKNITDITDKDIDNIYSRDEKLKKIMNDIKDVIRKDDKIKTVGDYMKKNGLTCFMLPGGNVIRRLSIDDGTVSNYFRKDKYDGNYTNLGGLKYYCVEVYKDKKGNTKLCGIRFIDLVNKNKKLFRKAESVPDDYEHHVMYLFENDFVTVYDKGGKEKIKGYYRSVYDINRSQLTFYILNSNKTFYKNISQKDTVKKTYIDILGKRGGDEKCSEPLQCIEVKKSR